MNFYKKAPAIQGNYIKGTMLLVVLSIHSYEVSQRGIKLACYALSKELVQVCTTKIRKDIHNTNMLNSFNSKTLSTKTSISDCQKTLA